VDFPSWLQKARRESLTKVNPSGKGRIPGETSGLKEKGRGIGIKEIAFTEKEKIFPDSSRFIVRNKSCLPNKLIVSEHSYSKIVLV
jgi:hypothetical protein